MSFQQFQQAFAAPVVRLSPVRRAGRCSGPSDLPFNPSLRAMLYSSCMKVSGLRWLTVLMQRFA